MPFSPPLSSPPDDGRHGGGDEHRQHQRHAEVRREDRAAIGTDAEEHCARHRDQVRVAGQDVGAEGGQCVDQHQREDVEHVTAGNERCEHEEQDEYQRRQPGPRIEDACHVSFLRLS
jgi:hypothetical protein